MFACCHPALSRDAQVALTLRAVCGLTGEQIARAFLVSDATMSQRLLRARKTLADTDSPVRVPDPDELADRLAQVLAVVYLFFNEGYLASSGREPARRDLAAQAIALTRTLHRLMPREPEVLGLLALLLLHESRAAARFDGWGRLIRLKDQDRSRWNSALAAEATRLLDRAMAMRRPGPYQVQAAIAALHAEAADYEQTDWRQIRLLYNRLQRLTPSPVVLLNRAVATRYAVGAEAGAGRDRAPARRSRRLPPLPRPPRRPAHRPRPRRRGGGRERPGAVARRQPGRTRPAHPRPVAVKRQRAVSPSPGPAEPRP